MSDEVMADDASAPAPTSSTAAAAAAATNSDGDQLSPNSKQKQPIEYMSVREILEKFARREPLPRVNVFGVVTFLPSSNKPSHIGQKDKTTQVTIVDQTCEFNDRLKLNVFSPVGERLISESCELGDIVRFHRLRVQDYNGYPQGVHMSKISSWVRFKRRPPATAPTTVTVAAAAATSTVNKSPPSVRTSVSPRRSTRSSPLKPGVSPSKLTSTIEESQTSPKRMRTRSMTSSGSPSLTSPPKVAITPSKKATTTSPPTTVDNRTTDVATVVNPLSDSIEFEFVGNKNNNTMEEQDKKFVRDLRAWLETNPLVHSLIEAGLSKQDNLGVANGDVVQPADNSHLVQLATNHQQTALTNNQLSVIRSFADFGPRETYYDVVCQVCAIGEHKGTRFLVVWDGTKSNHGFYQENQFRLEKETALYSPDLLPYLYQVFVFDEFEARLEALNAGDYVLLKNMHVRFARINSSLDFIMKMPGANPNNLRYGRAIVKLNEPGDNEMSENEIENRVREISRKGKEMKLKTVNGVEFLREFCKLDAGDINSTLNELIQQNNANQQQQRPPPQPADKLTYINGALADDPAGYAALNSQPTQQQGSPIKLLRRSPRISPQKRKRTALSELMWSCCDEIGRLRRLVKLTYFAPYFNSPPDRGCGKFEPYFTSLDNFAQEAAKHAYMRGKVMAKIFNYASTPAIASVFVYCPKCSYINFVPFHLAKIYQSASLNMIVRQQIDENSDQQEDQHDDRRARNFSYEWLNTAMPIGSNELAPSQDPSSGDSTQTYDYSCPRCELIGQQHQQQQANNDDEIETNKLSYTYRFWFVLRDQTSQLNPCALEDMRLVNSIDPLKFFTNSAKSHQVYNFIHKAVNRKYLFTIESFRVEASSSSSTAADNNPLKRLNTFYRIEEMIEIASST